MQNVIDWVIGHQALVASLAVGILEGARIIGVKRSTMYREINAGRIKALKLGKRTVIPIATLRAYLDSLPNY